MKVKVHSLDGDTDFLDIVADVLQGDSLTPYLFIICQDYVLWMSIDLMKENGFTQKRQEMIMDADYADNIACLANTPTQAESLPHSLEQATGGIDLHVNADKTEYMCFNQKRDISTLNCGSLKSVASSRTLEAVSHQLKMTLVCE